MKQWRYFIVPILLTLCVSSASVEIAKPDAAADKAAIQKVIDASIGWALNKDVALLYRSMAQDEEFFIYNPDSKSTIIGFENFKKLTEASWLTDDFKATRYEFRDTRVHLSKSGQTAWFSTLLDDCGEFKGKPACWKDARYTGVLEKRDGRWVLCQMHFSLATDKIPADAKKTGN
jgi:ketosteroid isomerase-like protein